MKSRLLRWTGWGVTLLVSALLLIAVLGYVYLSRSVPLASGEGLIAELGGKVEVVRDRNDVPHIRAKSIIDAAAVQGYVHAQERMWQMEGFRMAGQGRLSEMYGEATLETDIFLRTLDLPRYAKASFEKLEPETREILLAYTRGVNAFLQRPIRMFEPSLAPEFLILGHQPEPWEPWHSLLTPKIMALTLGSNLDEEIRRLTMASKGFSPAEIDELVPYLAEETPPPLPDLRELYGYGASGKTASNKQDNSLLKSDARTTHYKLAWPIGVTASNNWVVSGSRTKSGKVLLANDPHLGLTAPSIWYLNHLSYEKGGRVENLVGVSIPSIPLVMLGRNNKVAWGFTTTNLDAQDLYLERINANDPTQYLNADGWKKFQTRTETIKVSGGEDVVREFRSTDRGPLLPDKYRNISEVLPEGHGLSMRWLASSESDTTLDALVRTGQSQSVEQFIEATRRWVSPMQSVVVGDVDGNIGLVAPSRMAKRKAENTLNGRAPGLGWEEKYAWERILPFEANYKKTNPENGVLSTANSKYFDEDYPTFITYDWAKIWRRDRVRELIGAATKPHDMDSMINALGDDYSGAMVELRDIGMQLLTVGTRFDEALLTTLRSWDGRMQKDKPEPLIMIAWFRHMQELLFKDDLGDAYKLFDKGDARIVLNALSRGGTRDWCDNKTTAKSEACSDMAGDALALALAELEKEQGADWQQWSWGKAHIAYGEHRPFARVGPLAKFFNVEVESGGGPYTVFRGQTDFGEEKPYYNRHASSLRAVYDFENLDQSKFITTTGQSGHFMAKSYRTFSAKWADNGFITIPTQPKDYEGDALGTWVFERK